MLLLLVAERIDYNFFRGKKKKKLVGREEASDNPGMDDGKQKCSMRKSLFMAIIKVEVVVHLAIFYLAFCKR
jgi:hypothetical protein